MKMERKARTRTLIQLGGLLVKSGLVEALGIPLGVDLENNPEGKEKAYQLLSFLEGCTKTKNLKTKQS